MHSRKIIIRWVLGLAVILGMVAVFTDLVEDVWFREGFAWDKPVALAIHQFSSPLLDLLMRGVTQAGKAGAIAVVILAAAYFTWKRRLVDALSVLVSFGGAVTLNTLLKFTLTRPRPSLFPPLVAESGFSFPSGHVTAAVAVYGLLGVLLWRGRHYGWAIFSAAWIPLIAFSRIYLEVHYPSDTLGSLIITTLWLIVIFFVRDRYLRHKQ